MISAKIIAHSKSAVNGKEIVTFELEYPRFIHSELMTHRVFSRNAMSSRAVPIEKMCDQVCDNPAEPIHWGKNQPGMQAKEELTGTPLMLVQGMWREVAQQSSQVVRYMSDEGAHKQIANRILEPFQWMKTVVTATEFDNFFHLRAHADAQPEIKRLAEAMLEVLQVSHPNILNPGEWHVPYYEEGYWKDSGYIGNDMKALFNKRDKYSTLENALSISSSCCAQVSYRKLDDSLEKARMVYQRLVDSEPVHASPFEHQASPMNFPTENNGCSWEEGVTHMTVNGEMWSGNFKSWIQHRQLIPNNVCWKYKED